MKLFSDHFTAPSSHWEALSCGRPQGRKSLAKFMDTRECSQGHPNTQAGLQSGLQLGKAAHARRRGV